MQSFEKRLLKEGWIKMGDTLYSPDYDPFKDEDDDEDDDEDYVSEEPGCDACGNPAYPLCKSSCPLFDD
jgi:hypothetical protein